ncbi:MAG TPA: site-specific integrase [Puia sp.]|nr:site-specific integrase [Puia sp.]
MNDFNTYLRGKKMKASTIREHLNNVKRFMDWLSQENYGDAAQVQYADLLAYIQQEKQKELDPATINLRLTSISHYYEYLKNDDQVDKNPARTLRVKGTVTKVIQNPLSFPELTTLYQQYEQLQRVTHIQAKTDRMHQRNTVILGLLIWQAVHGGELQQMMTGHINLQEGMVYIPSGTRSNHRLLPLSHRQILPLNQYLQETRLQLSPKGDKLIPGSVDNILTGLTQELQGINPVIRNALHIRASVILHWLTLHNKREVQYMAGHRYISSTEKYAAQEMGNLTDQLAKHHPFG